MQAGVSLGRFARMAAATRRRSFGPVSTIMQNLYAKMARAPPPPQGASGGLRVWLQRRAGDPLVPFRQSCRISMPRWRERRRRRRVIVQRTLTPSRLPSAALRSLERIRLGISVSYVIQRVHEWPCRDHGRRGRGGCLEWASLRECASDAQEILWSRFDNHAESLCQDGESAAAATG